MPIESARYENRAELRLDARPCGDSVGDGLRLVSYARSHPERSRVEDFISRGFLRCHQACVKSFAPHLLALIDAAGAVQGAVGLRRADEEPLFLECYLDSSIEDVLSEKARVRVPRTQIVEAGNLACRNASMARCLMAVLPRYLIAHGALWITFTATRAVRDLIGGLGAQPLDLAPARTDCVAGAPDDWGKYYETDPRVMAGYLPAARQHRLLWGGSRED